MRKTLILTLGIPGFIILILICSCSQNKTIIAENGRSAYQIVIADETDTLIVHAANELQQYLNGISEVKIPEVIAEKRVEDKDIKISVTSEAKKLLAKEGFDESFGARPLKRTIQNLVMNPLAQMIIEGKVNEGDKVKVGVKDDKIEILTAVPKKMPRKKREMARV